MATVTLTTGLSASLLGTVSIAATLIDVLASKLTIQWDISQHLAGNPASMTAHVDVSLDGGLTWNFLCGAERDKGYAPLAKSPTPGFATMNHAIPGVGKSTRMVRAFLTTSAAVTTSLQVVIS